MDAQYPGSITSKISNKIRNFGFLCAVLVVCIHVPWQTEPELGVSWWIHAVIKEGLARVAVPFFFVVSGFFLARHFDEEGWWKRENKKRLRTLLIPFFVFILLAILLESPLGMAADVGAGRPFGTSVYIFHKDAWLKCFGFDLTDVPILPPLWYVRALILFTLAAGLFKYMVKRWSYMWLLAVFLFDFFEPYIPNRILREIFSRGFASCGMLYFSIGIMIRYGQLPIEKIGRWWGGGGGLALLVAHTAILFFFPDVAMWVQRIMIPFLLIWVWNSYNVRRIPDWLAACSFPVFLLHPIVFVYVEVICKRLAWQIQQINVAKLFLGILIPILFSLILRRTMPRFASFAFGGR